jgi:hypothetical protein
LRRDGHTKALIRTWVCAACQLLEERPEPE